MAWTRRASSSVPRPALRSRPRLNSGACRECGPALPARRDARRNASPRSPVSGTSAGHTSARAVRAAAVSMTARSSARLERAIDVGDVSRFRLLGRRSRTGRPARRGAPGTATRTPPLRARRRCPAADRETTRTGRARPPARRPLGRRRSPTACPATTRASVGKRSTGRIRPHAIGGSRRSGSSASPSGLATLSARNAWRPTTGMPISRSQLRLVRFDAHAPQRRKRRHARRRPPSHEGLAAPTRNARCDRRARSRAGAPATNAGSRPRAPVVGGPIDASSSAASGDAIGAPRSRAAQLGMPERQQSRAAPRRGARLPRRTAAARPRGATRRALATPAGRQLGQRRRRPRSASGSPQHAPGRRSRPERAPDVRGAAPHDRQQKIRHEAAHATARQPSGVDRRRPHSGIGPIVRFSISTGSAIGSSRRPTDGPIGDRRRQRPDHAQLERNHASRRERETARSCDRETRPCCRSVAPRRSTSNAGDTAGRQARPDRNQHVGRGELEQRPERESPRARRSRAPARRARATRPGSRAAPTAAARSRGAAATPPGSTGSAPPPSAPSMGRRPPGAAPAPDPGGARGATVAVRASGARTRTMSSIAASTGSGDTSVTPPGENRCSRSAGKLPRQDPRWIGWR